jgi:hypothetical protein
MVLGCVGVAGASSLLIPTAVAQTDPDSLGFTVSPSAGPPGTRVHFEGDVPSDAPDFATYQVSDAAYGLQALDVSSNSPDCELIVPLEHVSKTISDDGHVTGSFVIGAQGGCFMDPTDRGPQPAGPGRYEILLTCHACAPIGTFTITAAALPRTGTATWPLLTLGVGLVIVGSMSAAAGRGRLQRITSRA